MQAQFNFETIYEPEHSEAELTAIQVPDQVTTQALDALEEHPADGAEAVYSPRLWSDNGWTARVIKNEDDEGWAVEMCKDGESEPALVGPWTMGRDKKNPKPLDTAAFNTLVKTASEVLRRHEQQLHAMLHKSLFVNVAEGNLNFTLDIVPSEDEPHARLSAYSEEGAKIAEAIVAPNFKLSRESAAAWASGGYRKTL
jgi:hypothetical protein